MAEYRYHCWKCDDDFDRDFPIGTAPRAIDCHCGADSAYLSIGYGVNIAPSALENKGGRVRDIDKTEGEWHKDMPAYKRMRAKGMQPKQIDGAARLEDKADDQFDIRNQPLYEQGVSRERILEGTEQAAELIRDGVPL